MKKFSLSILIVLLCSVLIFSGCTKAKNANVATINALYKDYATKYGTYNNSEKIKIFDEYGQPDLYSNKTYNNELYTKITKLNDGSAYSTLNMLGEFEEFDAIMKSVSNFYIYKSFVNTLDVKQELLTEMYERVDDLNSSLQKTLKKKEGFETRFEGLSDDKLNSSTITSSLQSYFGDYVELIQKFYLINETYEKIFTTYVYVPEQVTPFISSENFLDIPEISVPLGETSRVVLSSQLYLGEYYYQKHFVLNNDLTNLFGHQTIYDKDSNTNIENTNYDELFAEFKEIVKNTANVGNPSNPTNPDAVTYYNACITKLDGLKVGVKNYTKAVEKVNEYLKKNNYKSMEQIEADKIEYHYVQFIKNFDNEIASYQTYLLNNIIFKTY